MMLSITNLSILRLEDEYNNDDGFFAELMITTEGGAYCEAKLRIFPNVNFRNIRM